MRFAGGLAEEFGRHEPQVHPARPSRLVARHYGAARACGRGRPVGDRVAPMSEMRIKQEAFALAQACLGFVILALVLLGIGGTIYKIISPDGWVAQAFGRSLSAGAAALGSLVMVVTLAWFSRASSPRRRTQFADIAVYGFAAAGLLYVVQLWIRGSF